MNIMIFTGCFGMGHISASYAIKQEIFESYPDAKIDIIDFMDLFPAAKKAVYKSYNSLVKRCPDIYNRLVRSFDKTSASAPLKRSLCKKIDDITKYYKPDLFISTIPLSSKYISAYKGSKNSKNIPLFTCITDIFVHSQWISSHTDAYFVASEKLKDFLISKGISKNSIYVTGIPVKKDFKRGKMQISDNTPNNILIMGGGLGLISDCKYLFKKLDESAHINATVITGFNKKLMQILKSKYKNIEVLGYVDNVYKYMQKSKIIITKPGGITLFESIHSQVPMLIMRPALAQEVSNAHYIEEEGIGRVIWDKKADIFNVLIQMLNDKDEYDAMKKRLGKIKNKTSYEKINAAIRELKICG